MTSTISFQDTVVLIMCVSDQQIYDIWKVRSEFTNTEQFRCLLTDGEELQHAIFPIELTEKVKNSTLKKGTVILLSKYHLYAHIYHPLKRCVEFTNMALCLERFMLPVLHFSHSNVTILSSPSARSYNWHYAQVHIPVFRSHLFVPDNLHLCTHSDNSLTYNFIASPENKFLTHPLLNMHTTIHMTSTFDNLSYVLRSFVEWSRFLIWELWRTTSLSLGRDWSIFLCLEVTMGRMDGWSKTGQRNCGNGWIQTTRNGKRSPRIDDYWQYESFCKMPSRSIPHHEIFRAAWTVWIQSTDDEFW